MTAAVIIVPMPQMGVSVTEGTVSAWHKAPGDSVAEGDVLCEIVTDKVDTEIAAPVAGVLTRIAAEVGQTVPVGEPLAELASPGSTVAPAAGAAEPAPADSPAPAPNAAPVTPAALVEAPGPPPPPPATAPASAQPSRFDPEAAAKAVVPAVGIDGGTPSSPVARRLAAERGINLQTVRGSGRRGRIRKADVRAAVEQVERAPTGTAVGATAATKELPRGYDGVPFEIVAVSPQRRAIAEHMVRSRHTAAHMTTEVEVDMHRVARVRAELNDRRAAAGEPKLSYLPFVARAACAALGDFPDLNATFDPDRLIRWQTVNLGIAIDTDRGLLVPVVRGCERLNVIGIADAVAELAARARSRRLVPDDMAGGTFTLSNPGSVGAVSAPAIINQPQVAILGMPMIVKRPVVVAGPEGEDVIVPRPIMNLALTFDHRAVDGAYATRCAVRIKDTLESWGADADAHT